MTGFGTNPTSNTPLSGNQLPLSEVAVPGEAGGNLTALEGGQESTDSNSNKTAAARVYEDAQAGYVALTSPQAQTNAGSETVYTFSQQVDIVTIQNNTSANVYFAFDTTATAGSLVLMPNATLIYSKKVTAVHLYTAAAQNVNGSSAGNVVLLGEV